MNQIQLSKRIKSTYSLIAATFEKYVQKTRISDLCFANEFQTSLMVYAVWSVSVRY